MPHRRSAFDRSIPVRFGIVCMPGSTAQPEMLIERCGARRGSVVQSYMPCYVAQSCALSPNMSIIGGKPEFSADTPAPENLLRAIVESSDDAIISKDLSGIVTSWNGSAERMFGYSAEEIIGRPITILIPGDRADEEARIISKVRAGERIDHFETVRLRKNGTLIDVAVSISPVRAENGKIVGASKVARDISETKRTTAADVLLAAIVNSSDDAIISKTLDGTITSWNLGAERIFGYAAVEIVGQSVFNLIPADRHDEEPLIIARLRAGERIDHFETVRLRKNGESFPISLTISPIRSRDGTIVGASKIVRDITELKELTRDREALLESERIARSQAEHANRMKDEFLSTVSHELRTPLNAIVGWTEVLATGGHDQNEVVHGIEVIKRNALAQAQLIEDLLDLGRISSGKMVLNTESVNLKVIANDAIASLQHAADMKRISLKASFEDFRSVMIGDPPRLQQIIWNLLTNAIKFTDSGGQVTIALAQSGSNVNLTVSDSGRGISPEFLPFLFERFRQADASTKRKTGGLGIGLALVKNLVELHGGKVRAESAGLGRGATFVVTLPVSVAISHSAGNQLVSASPAPELGDLTGIRVLALDDDADSLDLVTRILSTRGADVRTANSVASATEILKTFTPDVILSDIGMPAQDGYDFIRQLRERPFFAGIPAVALTALARVEDRTRALNAGFQSHIAKPLASAELVAVVRSLGRLRSARETDGPMQK
jgi:PAS domain S-box-containing protein